MTVRTERRGSLQGLEEGRVKRQELGNGEVTVVERREGMP